MTDTLGRPVPPASETGYTRALSHVYFDRPPRVICWGENPKNPNYGCDMLAETELLLCRQHYREIVGREPDA